MERKNQCFIISRYDFLHRKFMRFCRQKYLHEQRTTSWQAKNQYKKKKSLTFFYSRDQKRDILVFEKN